MPYSLVVEDEWGVPYAAQMFDDIQEVHDEIIAMEELIDECNASRAYALRMCIDQLKQIIHEAELEAETIPDRPAF